MGKCETPTPVSMMMPGGALDPNAVTIGEALEAASYSVRKKPVEQSDAAAVQAAEMRATGTNLGIPAGIAAAAQSAADANARLMSADDKTKLGDILSVIFNFSFSRSLSLSLTLSYS